MGTKTKCVWQAALVLVLAVGSTSSLFALDPQKSIAQYGHGVWVKQTGLPANAVNVAFQTRDGYLWLGTSAGLFRFDGVSFTEADKRIDSFMLYPSEGRANKSDLQST
jgi:ligand-binding sensor domain-containing protein